MVRQLKVNMILLGATLLVCCVLYPGVIWGVAHAVRPDAAEGSIITDATGRPVGSRLIAQNFSGAAYFKPRPTATSPDASLTNADPYNASASTGSNLAASNPGLRDRVAQAIGPTATDTSGKPVGPRIEAWFAQHPDAPGRWVKDHQDDAAAAWARDSGHAKVIDTWMKSHPAAIAQWKKDHAPTGAGWDEANLKKGPDPTEWGPQPFFDSYLQAHPGTWPGLDAKGKVQPLQGGSDIQAVFFDRWLQDNPEVTLRPVQADAVTTSGSGLDPDITLANARDQLDGVAAERAKQTQTPTAGAAVKAQVEKILEAHVERLMGGLIGGPVVNVVELNRDLDQHFGKPQAPQSGR